MDTDSFNIKVGDTTATREVLFALGEKIDESFRTQKINDKINPDDLRFYWCHTDVDSGKYDKNYGVPRDLRELQYNLEKGQYENTALDKYTVISKETTDPLPADSTTMGQLVEGRIFLVRKSLLTGRALNASEQKEVLELFSNFFSMDAIGRSMPSSIEELWRSETLSIVRKALGATFKAVWKNIPDVYHIKERFAKGKIRSLELLYEYITDITGCKKNTPDLTRYFSLFNSISDLVGAGVDGPSIMTALREETAMLLKNMENEIDIGESEAETELIMGQERFGVGMSFVMLCKTFGGKVPPTKFAKTLETLSLRLNKEVDRLEIDDLIKKQNKLTWYKEASKSETQQPKFRRGLWNKCYAKNKNFPSLDYISKEGLKNDQPDTDKWLVENLRTNELEQCNPEELANKLRDGGYISWGLSSGNKNEYKQNKFIGRGRERKNVGKKIQQIFQNARQSKLRFRANGKGPKFLDQSDYRSAINKLEEKLQKVWNDELPIITGQNTVSRDCTKQKVATTTTVQKPMSLPQLVDVIEIDSESKVQSDTENKEITLVNIEIIGEKSNLKIEKNVEDNSKQSPNIRELYKVLEG